MSNTKEQDHQQSSIYYSSGGQRESKGAGEKSPPTPQNPHDSLYQSPPAKSPGPMQSLQFNKKIKVNDFSLAGSTLREASLE